MKRFLGRGMKKKDSQGGLGYLLFVEALGASLKSMRKVFGHLTEEAFSVLMYAGQLSVLNCEKGHLQAVSADFGIPIIRYFICKSFQYRFFLLPLFVKSLFLGFML